jgi:lathosterol oxidase
MDIALELCDTFLLDYMYKAILPAQPAPYSLRDGTGNATALDYRAASKWEFKPASTILSFTPRDAAYMSAWDRDNIYRQMFSLFLITW